MNNNLKEELQIVFDAPKPPGKEAFIREIRKHYTYVYTDRWSILLSQIGYIRKSVWFISFGLLVFVILGIIGRYKEMLYITASLTPFISGVAVLESVRSRFYEMEEMEAATVYSLRGILFARITLIGISHLILLFALTMVLGSISGKGYLVTGSYITIPYLMSSVVGMEVERTAYGRSHSYVCVAVAVIVSMLVVFTAFGAWKRFVIEYPSWCVLAAFVLFLVNLNEYRKLYNWEEYAWNL